jgi:IS605 OrfB family transposase
MPNIHRSYEVLIEETVTAENRQHRKRGTDKEHRFNAKTMAALELTNEMFQDAVCYYTLMLAGMVKGAEWTEETLGYVGWMRAELGDEAWKARRARMLGQQINPLWKHITESHEMSAATANVVKRLSEEYPHAIFHGSKDADDIVRKAFCYKGTKGKAELIKRNDLPAAENLVQTFVAHLMPKVVQVKSTGDSLFPNLKSFANDKIADLCNPSSQAKRLVGFYDEFHQQLRAMVEKTEPAMKRKAAGERLTQAKERKAGKAEKDSLRKAVEAAEQVLLQFLSQSGPLHDELVSRIEEIAGERTKQLATQREINRQNAVAAALQEAAADPKRKPENTDELLRQKAEKSADEDWAKRLAKTKATYRSAFLDTKTAKHLRDDLPTFRAEIEGTGETDPRFCRLQELGAQGVKRDDKAISKPLYRLLWILGTPEHDGELRRKAAADVLEFVVANEPVTVEGDGDRMPFQQTKGEPLFPFFTNCLGLQPDQQCVFKPFDVAAFKRATEDVFKYANRTTDRQKKIETLQADLKLFEGRGRESEKKNKDGTPRYAIYGMEGDERRERMEAVLLKLGKDRASGETGYGLRPSTIGGWVYLRPELIKAYDQGQKNSETADVLEERLLNVVDDCRSKSGGGFGSADFFYALCQTDNHVLWQEKWPNPQPWHAPDFVSHYTRFAKKREDLQNIADDNSGWKPKAINYTWPGQLHVRKRERSFRPFDFKCNICTNPQMDLFAKDASGRIQRVTTNKADKGKPPEFPLTLSFRRLKRDRITDPAGNSVEAFFAPPKIAVTGAAQPPLLAGPGVRPSDISSKTLDAFLEDLPKKKEMERLLKAIAGELGKHHREIQRLSTESQTSAKEKEQLRKERNVTVGLICAELNRLIECNEPLYKADDLSKAEQQRIADAPAGLEHRLQNRKAIEKILGGFLKDAASCYNENVSLLAPKRPDGAFHLMFAVELKDEQLKDFRVPQLPEGQQFQDAKQGETWVHAHLRWPVDLNTETEWRKRKAEKAKATGEDMPDADEDEEGTGKRPALPKREDLWCAAKNLETPVHALFVDLGVRFAAAWTRARIRKAEGAKPDTAHIISPPKGHPDYDAEIWCEFYGQEGTFRLQGEDAKVWHRPKGGDHDKQDRRYSRQEVAQTGEDSKPQWPGVATAKDGWRFGRELYGSRGRLATSDEIKRFKELAEALFPATNRFPLPSEHSEAARFIPAMAEHLVARLDRRLGRINFLFNLRWRLEGTMEQDATTRQFTQPRDIKKEQPRHYRIVVESLAPTKLHPTPEDVEELCWNDELRNALTSDWKGLDGLLKKPKTRKERENHEAEWAKKIAADSRWQWKQLADAVHSQLTRLVNELGVPGETGMVAQVARFVWPLRDKYWHWQKYTASRNGDPCPSLLSTEPLSAGSETRKIIGQGGLNMQRIELLRDFRGCCHSLAKHEKRAALGRFPGKEGVEPVLVQRDESVPDPCPSFLEKVNELRDQRVDQTAALILAEALGLELMNPADVSIDGLRKWQLKSQRDIHGRYQRRKIMLNDKEVEAPPCSLIVVEDLSRYLTRQDRSRFENRRLMEWSHRQVIKKLKDMAQVFGVEIVAVDARYSSRFCSKTHVPGVRVAEVKRGFEKEHPWRKWHDEKFNGKETERAKHIRDVVSLFAVNQNFDKSLLIEMDGGPLFLPCNSTSPVNADINASKSIGFRAIAHPDLWEFFPVIRTESAGDGKLRIINRRGALAALKPDDPKREFPPTAQKAKKERAVGAASDDDDETSERPYLYVAGVPNSCALPLDNNEDVYDVSPTTSGVAYRTARGGLFWRRVTETCRKNIHAINEQRMKSG